MVRASDIPAVEVMAANIVALVREASAVNPRYIADGMNWYNVAHNIAHTIARESGATMLQVAHVIATLSPQKTWPQNIADARDVSVAFRDLRDTLRDIPNAHNGVPVDIRAHIGDMRESRGEPRGLFATNAHIRECAFVLADPRNVESASIAKLSGEITGRKRQAFVTNIVHPNFTRIVTVDAHACRIAIDNVDDSGTFPKSRYDQFVAAYTYASDVLGIEPMHVQAITWIYWRATRERASGRKHRDVIRENRERGY